MKRTLTALLLSLLLASCSHKVIVTFEQESPDIVPSDDGLYKNYSTVCIKSANQNIVYSSNELTSRINIVTNIMEREFQKQNFKILKELDNPDLLIELVAIDPYDYHTNKAKKANGKKKKLPCDYSQNGFRSYVKITTKAKQTVNYTFFATPCTTGCGFNYKAYCERFSGRRPKHGLRRKKVDLYEGTTKRDDFPTEQLGKFLAAQILYQIRSS